MGRSAALPDARPVHQRSNGGAAGKLREDFAWLCQRRIASRQIEPAVEGHRRRIGTRGSRAAHSSIDGVNGVFCVLALESSLMNRTIGSTILFLILGGAAFAQPEVMAWGNLTGLRVDGHLLELATSMCVAQPGLAGVSCTGREKQQNSYSRNGKSETVSVQMRAPRDSQGAGWAMNATEVVEDTGPYTAKIDLQFTSPGEANIGGA